VGIYALPGWLRCSPDLNCVEYVWYLLKGGLNNLVPHPENTNDKERQKKILLEYFLIAWASIKTVMIDHLVESMPRRIQAIIDANGWQTKY
jgi:hypothetical protein